jgi:hypothetical protein
VWRSIKQNCSDEIVRSTELYPSADPAEALVKHLESLISRKDACKVRVQEVVELILALEKASCKTDQDLKFYEESRVENLARLACYKWNCKVHEQLIQSEAFQTLL